MERLGHPQNKFPAVHVAGTNGKGSVSMMIANALWRSGLRAGLYTSPHLSDLRERFQIQGKCISERDLTRHANRLRSVLHSGGLGFSRLTQFEFLTAIAFLWFAEKKVPMAVIEVGLGGRLDATNVLDRPLVSVITTIGRDHMAWLGSTIPSIAREKGGIIKPGVPVVTGTSGVAKSVLRRMSQGKKAPFYSVSKERTAPRPRRLLGEHQRLNAEVASQTLKRLHSVGIPLHKWGIIQGIREAKWPGRYELVKGPKGRRIILDGAHNPEAVAVLAKTIRSLERTKVDLLVGILKDKEIDAMIYHLASIAESVTVTDVPSSRKASPFEIAVNPRWKTSPVVVSNPNDAIEFALSEPTKRPLLITGSLFLVGALRPRLVQ